MTPISVSPIKPIGSGPAHRFCRPGADCRAFTLLEVMVALLLMSIVLLAVFQLHAQSISMATEMQTQTTAPLLAQQKLGELELQPSEKLASDSGDFGDAYKAYRWRTTVEDIEVDVFENADLRLTRIDITVITHDTDIQYNLRTYRFVPK